MKSTQSIHSTLPIQRAVDELPGLVEFNPSAGLQTPPHELHHFFVSLAFHPNFREHCLFHLNLLFHMLALATSPGFFIILRKSSMTADLR